MGSLVRTFISRPCSNRSTLRLRRCCRHRYGSRKTPILGNNRPVHRLAFRRQDPACVTDLRVLLATTPRTRPFYLSNERRRS